jgi:protoheme IX farnesyltransferase
VRGAIAAYAQLAKPRLALLLLFVAAASFLLGSGKPPDGRRLAGLAAGTVLLAAGLFALNQYLERDTDRLMQHTRRRPLPAGVLRPVEALRFGLALSALSLAVLFLQAGRLAAWLGLFTLAAYLAYTWLKTRTLHHTTLGSLSGAMPVLLGWVAATGRLDLDAWVLFAILFFWQFPHFLAIEVMYREDYRRAGIRVLPVADPRGRRTAGLLLGAQALLLAASALPVLTGLARPVYLVAAGPLGVAFFVFGVLAAGVLVPTPGRGVCVPRGAAERGIRAGLRAPALALPGSAGTRASPLAGTCGLPVAPGRAEAGRARQLLLASVAYLPLLFLALVISRR